MGSSIIRDPKRIFSQLGGDPSLTTRITTLEDVQNKVTYFFSIPSGTTGTITIPTGATIILDELYSGADAFINTITSGQPTGIFPYTAGGTLVDVTSFNSSGDYVLSGTPSAYPVALIYQLSIKEKDLGNLTQANILDMEDIQSMPYLTGAAGTYIRGNGLGVAPIVSTLVLPNTATSGQIVRATSSNNYGGDATLTHDGATFTLASATQSQLAVQNGATGNKSFLIIGPSGFGTSLRFQYCGTTFSTSGMEIAGEAQNFTVNLVYSIGTFGNNNLKFWTNNTHRGTMTNGGLFFWGGTSTPTALFHLAAGTATTNTAPLK